MNTSPNATALLRALKGPPISIIMALLLHPDRTLGPARLAHLTGYSERSTRTGLSALAELGLAQRHAHHNGWTSTAHLRQLILAELPPQQTTTGSLPQPANSAASQYQPANSAASPPVVVVESIPGGKDQQQPAQPEDSTAYHQALVAHLEALGIWTHTAQDLALDPWITADRAEAWHHNILEQLSRHPGSVRNPAALLAANLAAHREPPPPPEPWTDHHNRGGYEEYG